MYAPPSPPGTRAPWTVVAATLAAIFVVDLFLPLGYAIWALYLVPVALTIFAGSEALPPLVAAAATVLTAVGYLASPLGSVPRAIVLANRGFGVAAYWGVALTARSVVRARLAMARETWIRAGLHAIADATRGDHALADVATRALAALAAHVGADVGALHVGDDGGLERVAGFALAPDAGAARFGPGEGVPGRALREGRPVEVRALPADYLRVTSGVGAHGPARLVAAPITAGGAPEGVVELAAFDRFPADTPELLSRAAEPIGVAVRSARGRAEREALLARTQAQAARLAEQEAELRAANEELQSQSDALRDSQARLEAQQAELEQTNEQLEEQAATLERQRDDLERRGAELARTAAELDRASRFKSEFLANMSHELRTPLNSALILSKLLADNPAANLTDEQVRWARTIHQAGNDLLALVNDVLDLAKVEAGRLEIRPEPVAPARLVEQLAATFAPVAAERGLAFERVVEASAPAEVVTDGQRLAQILQNFLSNAFKFTEHGGVTLRVAGAPGERVAFSVSDTGVGIPEDQHALVFEAFRQADSGTSRRYGGTGLGLAISRELAELLGGSIALESAPDRGSTFTLELPRALAGERGVAPRALAPARGGAAPARPPPDAAARRVREAAKGGPRRVLVVEDDAAFAGVLCDLARESRFEPEAVATAEEAVARARADPPAAVLLDVGLPDQAGLTVLDRLKRDPRTRHVPVHVVSVSDYAQVALEMGAVGYALKPVRREQLVAAFARIEDRLDRRVRKVLVVEDDPVQQEAVGRLLATERIETVPARTVAEALARLREAAVDCVVMDLVLPDGSGFDLLERMSADERAAFPPVIVYTGRPLSADDEARLRRHSRSIIVKGARSPERLLDEVVLFLHEVEADLPAEQRRMLQLARSRDQALEGRRILLVEDDVRNVFALSAVLEQRGAVVAIARTGREALDALARDPAIDLVLIDVMMPEMDGYEATRRIRADDRFAKLPVIAITARAMADDRQRCLDAGANDYVPKPIDVDRLLSLVRVWLPRRSRP